MPYRIPALAHLLTLKMISLNNVVTRKNKNGTSLSRIIQS